MAPKMLRVVERKAIPQGTEAYESQRSAIFKSLSDKIPESLRLPEDIIDNPPLDVTGIFRSCGLLSEKDLTITESYDAARLASAIASRELKAVEVAVAFAKRAAIAHQLTCCLTDWFMDEAVEQAQYLDDYLEKHGKTVGPLHGVPISVKEHIPLKNHFSSWGFLASRLMSTQDCQITQILRDAGAVFYVKTNQPQAIMHLETVSSFGRALMPHNIDLSAGGSSGGESALVSCRGSILGIGTDIGGSIRGPAAFCGIYGFKPTAYTLPMKDCIIGGFPGELNIVASIGPMCTTLRDCDLFVSVLKAANPHLEDPRIIPIPWTGLATPTELPLKIGIITHDDVIVPQPPVLAALAWAEKQFSAHGLKLKAFKPFKVATAMANIRKAYWPDSGLADVRICEASGEPLLPLTSWIIKDALDTVERTGTEVNAMRWARDTFRADFARHWNEQDVDIIIAPAFVGPACAHETALYWNYTAFWNYTDCPAIVFPTPIIAGETKEEYSAEYSTALSKEDEHVREMWKETDFRGAPINLQIIARKHHDNQLFGALNVLKDVLNVA